MTIKACVKRFQRQSPGALGSLRHLPHVLHPWPNNHSRSPPASMPALNDFSCLQGWRITSDICDQTQMGKKRALQFGGCNLNFWWMCRMEFPFKMRVRSQNAWDKEFVENLKVKVETWGCTYGKPVSEWRNKDRMASQRGGESWEFGFKKLFYIVNWT